jgi:hypothetical protein
MTCAKKVIKKKTNIMVGVVCKSPTDALKICLEHHVVADAIKCQQQFEKVIECQRLVRNKQ